LCEPLEKEETMILKKKASVAARIRTVTPYTGTV
jgi:hypothetical protein